MSTTRVLSNEELDELLAIYALEVGINALFYLRAVPGEDQFWGMARLRYQYEDVRAGFRLLEEMRERYCELYGYTQVRETL